MLKPNFLGYGFWSIDAVNFRLRIFAFAVGLCDTRYVTLLATLHRRFQTFVRGFER